MRTRSILRDGGSGKIGPLSMGRPATRSDHLTRGSSARSSVAGCRTRGGRDHFRPVSRALSGTDTYTTSHAIGESLSDAQMAAASGSRFSEGRGTWRDSLWTRGSPERPLRLGRARTALARRGWSSSG